MCRYTSVTTTQGTLANYSGNMCSPSINAGRRECKRNPFLGSVLGSAGQLLYQSIVFQNQHYLGIDLHSKEESEASMRLQGMQFLFQLHEPARSQVNILQHYPSMKFLNKTIAF